MKNPKVLVAAVGIGFFLSFFTALISGAGIGGAFLRAIVSALICAIVVAALLLAMQKFLLDGFTDSTDESPSREDRAETSFTGNSVNIVLDDEELPADPDDPKFDVRNIERSIGKSPAGQSEDLDSYQSASLKSKVAAAARIMEIDAASPRKFPAVSVDPVKDAPAPDAKFLPLGILGAAATGANKTDAGQIAAFDAPRPQEASFSGAEVSAASSAGADTESPQSDSDVQSTGTPALTPIGGGLVDLPDIGQLVIEGLSTEDDIISDTDFASATKDEIASGRKNNSSGNIDISDSKAIAGAIRTLLASE